MLKDRARKMESTKDIDCIREPEEVTCDVCTEPNRKAKKSCLVCLTSYCATHLENHYSAKRLKGHKLVEPVKNLDARACLTHGRSFELYNRNQQMCICVQCLEGGQEEVVSIEEEWNTKKAELGNNKAELQQRILMRKRKMDEINKALKSCKEQLEWWDIEAVFTMVISIVEAANAKVVKPLQEMRQLLEKEAKDLKDELEAEINRLETTIAELDNISALEDHIYFLQRYPSISVQEIEMKNWANVKFDAPPCFGSMRETTTTMIKNIQHELEKLATIELKRLPKFAVDVRLDPETAHQRLVLSPDGKEVRDGGEDQDVVDSPERFDVFGSVLGLHGFMTGKSYWEVEVNNKSGWDLGVARGSANRTGELTLNPDNGYWVLVHYDEENYAAMTAPAIRLSLEEKPETVGVFVDYEDGLVSFYDVIARSHIYSFTQCSFRDEIYPYFSPHFKQDEVNSEALVISTFKN